MSAVRGKRSGRIYLSWALFALSIALFAAFGILWYQDRQDNDAIPTPPSIPGQNAAINVKQALEHQGLEVKFEPGGGRSDELTVAGQLMSVDGHPLYVFIYPEGVASREDESVEIDPEAFTVSGTDGEPIAGGPPAVFTGSNVIVALYGAPGDVAAKVQQAIEGLP